MFIEQMLQMLNALFVSLQLDFFFHNLMFRSFRIDVFPECNSKSLRKYLSHLPNIKYAFCVNLLFELLIVKLAYDEISSNVVIYVRVLVSHCQVSIGQTYKSYFVQEVV